MTTSEKCAKIAAYFALHRSRGLTDDEAIAHIADGLGIERATVLVALKVWRDA